MIVCEGQKSSAGPRTVRRPLLCSERVIHSIHLPPQPPMQPSPPLSLSPEEWLALFPADDGPRPSSVSLGFEPEAQHPESELRVSRPLTAATMARELSWIPMMDGIARMQFALSPAGDYFAIRSVAANTTAVLLLVPIWIYNDGRFGHTQLACGTAALVFSMVALAAAHFSADSTRAWIRRNAQPIGVRSMDSSTYAGLVRYLEHAQSHAPGDGEDGSQSSSLLKHDAEDSLCPCPACMRPLLSRVGVSQIVVILMLELLLTAACFFPLYTALVTFGPQVWRSPWAVLGFLSLVAQLAHGPLSGLIMPVPSVSLLRIPLKLQRRAVKLALSDFLARYNTALSHGETAKLPKEELFQILYLRLISFWESGQQAAFNGTERTVLVFASTEFVGVIINIVGGSCVSGFSIFLLTLLLGLLLINLINLAVANEQIKVVAELFSIARDGVQKMLLHAEIEVADPAAVGDKSGKRGVVSVLLRQEAILASYSNVDRFRGKMLGFAVDAGFAKATILTLITLGFGLWTLLRGSGVFLTLDTICPTR